ncbi:MAG: dipeptide epimerase [Candidatus Omnitrophica bacterium]|nr:dipeptide epimerase [Candidatus Omnitrophota bacterium]
MKIPWHVKPYEFQLRDPFGLSRGTRRSVRNLFIRIGEGWGEGAPVYYRGQTIQAMESMALEWLESPLPLDRPIQEIMREVEERYPGETAFWQAVDLALHDHWGKKNGAPIRTLWNYKPSPLLSSFTIGMDDLDAVMQKVEKAASHPILKIKVGGERDLETLRAIHQRTKKKLYVDANEGWSYEQALEYLPLMREWGVQLIEQPLPGGDFENYRRLHEANRTGVPIILDESVHGPEDIESWIGRADGINIKLAKCGGLTRARRMLDIARKNGMQVMLGCMIESSLGIAAAAQLASEADFLDLDGAALVSNDPFSGLSFQDGVLILSNDPGFGVTPSF